MKKVLFVGAHRFDRSPSQRYRFEQYFEFLKSQGFHCDLAYIINEKDDKRFYRKGDVLFKLFFFLKSFFIRLKHVFQSRKYDAVYVQREAFMIGTTMFERLFKVFSGKLIFDFDDAIWLPNVSEGNKALNFLKDPKKTEKLIKAADMVFAGNDYLKDYALQFNSNVKIVPTTIDTSWYKPGDLKQSKVCIGWTGSSTTIQHFETLIPVLRKLKEKYGDAIRFKVIGDPNYVNKELDIQGLPWKSDTEVEDLQDIDIGVMPLPDSQWTQGKCACKGLQYMAAGIATIMSPVGVNKDIIIEGENGFLANSENEWLEAIEKLIENEALRKSLGEKGRNTVVDDYSVESNKHLYLEYFNELINSK